ncbi:hypothetical protein HNP88_000811 [Methanococcus maripaludis]|uniref:Uncharacterized protein n=1 Tax=Methanococcus maripaludis TaxID=39152 RepID=A0A7J9NMC4_METMI|nr:hypothetical protein [Methanococcus maripaludis]MBA2846627.1 hypothetical protein [Methanococcus maripaludis]
MNLKQYILKIRKLYCKYKVPIFYILKLILLINIVLTLLNGNLKNIVDITTEISLNCFSILIGLVIATVGILIGTLSTLYNSMVDLVDGTEQRKNDILDSLDDLDRYVRELKENTLFLVFLFVGNILFIYMAKICSFEPINPYFSYWGYPIFSKEIFLASIGISIIILGVITVYDIVKTIFTIHDHYMVIMTFKTEYNTLKKKNNK